MIKYFVNVDNDGNITIGNSITLSDDFPHEVTEEIFNNQNNYKFLNGQWTYDGGE